MANLTYWQKRFLQVEQLLQQAEDAYIKRMSAQYTELSKRINSEINSWMEKYAENDGITREEADKLLTKMEQKNWSMTLEQFRQKAIEGGYEQELNREYFRSRISRLEQLQRQLYFEFAEMANEQESGLDSYLQEQLNEVYLRNIYEFTDRGSFITSFARYSSKQLELAVRKPWAGGNFSSRVWGNHLKNMPDKLSKVLSQSIVNGWGTDKTVKHMMHHVDKELRNRMVTLVQTEASHIAEMASQKSYEETGVEKYEWLATLEIHTCEQCGRLDGQQFPVDDKNGIKPPAHPNCRCTTVPVVEGFDLRKRWQRDPVTGKGSVEDYQTFEEWKQKYVTPEVEKKFKIEKSRTADKKQFDRYQSVLGKKNMPKNLEAFKDLKYNGGNKWDELKVAYLDKNLQKKIQSEYNLSVHEGRQGKHILGHNNFKEGKSYLLDVINPQELIDKYAGTGEIQRRRGKWTNKELIIQDEFIGVNSSLDGSLPFTNRFFIHYSKNGTHIVPTLKGASEDES